MAGVIDDATSVAASRIVTEWSWPPTASRDLRAQADRVVRRGSAGADTISPGLTSQTRTRRSARPRRSAPVRMECPADHLALVAAKDPRPPQTRSRPAPRRGPCRPTRRGDPAPIGAEGDPEDRAVVAGQGVPFAARSSPPGPTSQIRTIRSWPAVARRAPSGLKATPRPSPDGADHVVVPPTTSQTLTMPRRRGLPAASPNDRSTGHTRYDPGREAGRASGRRTRTRRGRLVPERARQHIGGSHRAFAGAVG